MAEEYKVIQGFEKYQVSNLGNVRNSKTLRELKPRLNNSGYYQVHLMNNDGISKRAKLLHRLVCESFKLNPNAKRCVDHINNNRLDNRIENLRFATYSENKFNSKVYKNNKSSAKGVAYDTEREKYMVYIYKNGKRFYLGRYESLEEAIEKRKQASNQMFKEFTHQSERN